MTADAQPARLNAAQDEIAPRNNRQRIVGRFFRHRMAVAGLLLLFMMLLYTLGGALIYTEAQANYNDPTRRLQPPSLEHPFGTDTVGRDILARTIYGGQISLMIGLFAVTLSISIGGTVGVIAGYYGGLVDSVLMRITEAMLSVPSLLLLLVMSKFFSGRIPTVEFLGRTLSGSVIVIILIIGFTGWMTLARIVRSQVLSLKASEYVLAARALGASTRRVILRHVVPNTIAPIIVYATLGVATAILAEAYVSFLGLGVRPPTATWGNMLEGATDHIETAPWLWFYPGLCIILTLLGINFVGDGLRDATDPRGDNS